MSKKKNGAPPAPAAPRTTKGTATEAAYFLSLSLENVRCFGAKQTLDLSDGKGRPARWTILLGNNGTGKTTVLQALVALEHRPGPVKGWNARGEDFLRLDSDRNLFRSDDTAVDLSANIAYGGRLHAKSRQYQSQQCHLRLFLVNADPNSHAYESEPGSAAPPVCYAYGASRRMSRSGLGEAGIDDATATLFSDRAELRNAEEWLLQTDYAASKKSDYQEIQKRRRDQVADLLLHILPEVTDLHFVVTGAVWAKAHVEFKTPYGWVPLRQLGYGYRTLIAWMVDFASRMVERYPDSADPLAEPAVVLVDEIDLHLHPKWQRQLIGYLTARFPNTQFIATAHSPLIIQAANSVGANVALLKREGDHVVIENDPPALRGWSVDQLLTSELYDLPSPYPAKYDELFAKREAILTKNKLTKADQKELDRLDEEMAELPLGDTAAQAKDRMAINNALDLLEQRLGKQP